MIYPGLVDDTSAEAPTVDALVGFGLALHSNTCGRRGCTSPFFGFLTPFDDTNGEYACGDLASVVATVRHRASLRGWMCSLSVIRLRPLGLAWPHVV